MWNLRVNRRIVLSSTVLSNLLCKLQLLLKLQLYASIRKVSHSRVNTALVGLLLKIVLYGDGALGGPKFEKKNLKKSFNLKKGVPIFA